MSGRRAAFLRAINVGGRTVKKERLVAIFEAAGAREVETFLASGNLLFASPEPEAALVSRLEAELEGALGYPVASFVRDAAALEAIAAATPFDEALPTLNVGFLAAAPSAEVAARVEALSGEVDRLAVRGRELWWGCRVKQSESRLSNAALERALGARTTLRTLRTVQRLLERL